jgi:hypothetical protein
MITEKLWLFVCMFLPVTELPSRHYFQINNIICVFQEITRYGEGRTAVDIEKLFPISAQDLFICDSHMFKTVREKFCVLICIAAECYLVHVLVSLFCRRDTCKHVWGEFS